MSRQGAKFAEVKRIPQKRFFQIVKILIPRVTFALFAPLREERNDLERAGHEE
jgi:hypothetical protein